jgi:hypothetical protein
VNFPNLEGYEPVDHENIRIGDEIVKVVEQERGTIWVVAGVTHHINPYGTREEHKVLWWFTEAGGTICPALPPKNQKYSLYRKVK